MVNGNLKSLLKKAEDRIKKREKKRKPKMKVSGAGVKKLQEMINDE